jgi:hypothetical protein
VRQTREGNCIAWLTDGTRPLIEDESSTPNGKLDTANGSAAVQCLGAA